MPTGGPSKACLADERGNNTGIHRPVPEPHIQKGPQWQPN